MAPLPRAAPATLVHCLKAEEHRGPIILPATAAITTIPPIPLNLHITTITTITAITAITAFSTVSFAPFLFGVQRAGEVDEPNKNVPCPRRDRIPLHEKRESVKFSTEVYGGVRFQCTDVIFSVSLYQVLFLLEVHTEVHTPDILEYEYMSKDVATLNVARILTCMAEASAVHHDASLLGEGGPPEGLKECPTSTECIRV